jgi:hypothetical protein
VIALQIVEAGLAVAAYYWLPTWLTRRLVRRVGSDVVRDWLVAVSRASLSIEESRSLPRRVRGYRLRRPLRARPHRPRRGAPG